jgi:hypothetical protein
VVKKPQKFNTWWLTWSTGLVFEGMPLLAAKLRERNSPEVPFEIR